MRFLQYFGFEVKYFDKPWTSKIVYHLIRHTDSRASYAAQVWIPAQRKFGLLTQRKLVTAECHAHSQSSATSILTPVSLSDALIF